MNIELKPALPRPAAEETIVVGGRDVGKLITRKDETGTYYHAIFKLSGVSVAGSCLIQGHGETPAKAIEEAIRIGRDDAQRAMIEIDALEALLNS